MSQRDFDYDRGFTAGEAERETLQSNLDRVTAERDALQHRLTAADERADDLSSAAIKALDVLRALLKVNACGVHYAAAQMACHQLSAALKPADGFLGSTCNEVREEAGLPINRPCKACNGSACIDR